MGLIQEQPNLTVLDQAFEDTRRRTWPGMGHFAGSGPQGKTCRECKSWTGCGHDYGYYAKGGKHGGSIKPRPCQKYQELMGGEVGPPVPHNAAVCKYFAENAAPPAITSR